MKLITDLFKGFNLTDDQKEFLIRSGVGQNQASGRIPQQRVISEMYLIKHAEKNTNALITSNKELAKSNAEHATAMHNLTRALVGVALLQVIVAAIALYFNV